MAQDFHILRAKTRMHREPFGMFSTLKIALISSLAFGLSACGPSDPDSAISRQDLRLSQEILADVVETESTLSPQASAELGLTNTRSSSEKQLLDDHSQAGFERKRLTRIELLQRVQSRPRLLQSHQLARRLSIAESALRNLVRLEQSGHGRYSMAVAYPYAIDPFSGVWLEGPAILAYDHSIDSSSDAVAYLRRMEALADGIDDTRRRLMADEAVGHSLPKPIVDATMRNIQLMLVGAPNSLAQVPDTLANLTLGIPAITPEERAAFIDQASEIQSESIRPSFNALLDFLEGRSQSAPNSVGLWGQPSGYETYLSLLTFHATETVSPEQLHSANLEANVDALEKFTSQLAFDEGIEEPESFTQKLELFYLPAPQTIEAPPQDTLGPMPLERPARQFLALNHPDWASYFNPLRVSYLDDLKQRASRYTGLQQFASYDAVMQGLHLYVTKRKRSADTLTDYLILIETSLAAIDTGIHHSRWSFEQSIGYMSEFTGLPETLSRQAVIWVSTKPGLESAKMVAYRRILSLSDRAQAVLGNAYDENEFQAVITNGGPRPLSMIEADIEQWYAGKLDQ